ncbi:MAG: polysaccharide deacetylase family protein [Paludibacteraceae bacterium]|nr:polysaccharide deacetylase family protein [Paludibacteraceae bacterium]MBO7316305.1 polysaccharide deacetylase family protein [Paludibacteraceae bacterium]
MLIEQPPFLLKKFYPKALWRKNEEEKVVYLTFDDGPCQETTLKILDILDDFDVKATFFCVGENVIRESNLFDEIKKRGHRVGNHTLSHSKGFELSTADYISQVERARELISSSLFRPPHGQLKKEQYREISKKYTIVMWDVITRDYNQKLTPEKIFNIVKKYTRNGSIIVFHDSKKAQKNVLSALPSSLNYLKEKGFRFAVLE